MRRCHALHMTIYLHHMFYQIQARHHLLLVLYASLAELSESHSIRLTTIASMTSSWAISFAKSSSGRFSACRKQLFQTEASMLSIASWRNLLTPAILKVLFLPKRAISLVHKFSMTVFVIIMGQTHFYVTFTSWNVIKSILLIVHQI